jgi:glucose/arabinose dehydrogenase
LLITAIFLFIISSAYSSDFNIVKVLDNLENPWSLAFLPGNSVLVTERSGSLLLYKNSAAVRVSGLPAIHADGQGGLLDIALHPDFKSNQLVYFTYSFSERGESGTALYRGKLEGTRLAEGGVLYKLPKLSSSGVHYGSRIVFAPDGTLYMTIGERGDRHRAQKLDDAAGATLRFNDDGSIPEDNPFRGKGGALPEIYSYGHRNAQGMAVHPETGEIWQHEHGPKGGDEVNIIRPGANYGWPLVTYGLEYSGRVISRETSAPGIEEPVLHWTPSIAPSGMMFYSGKLFPRWKGNLFAGALAGQHLRRVELKGKKVVEEEMLLEKKIGRIRDVREAPDGTIWLITDERKGALYRIEPLQD